jgi:hypothetical protein
MKYKKCLNDDVEISMQKISVLALDVKNDLMMQITLFGEINKKELETKIYYALFKSALLSASPSPHLMDAGKKHEMLQ